MDAPKTPAVPRGVVILLVVLFVVSVAWLNYGNYRGATEEGVRGAELYGMLLVNTLLLAIPTGLLYFSIGVLVAAYRQKRGQGSLSPRLAKFIYFTPRIAGVVIIAFLTLFSFDVFEEGGNIWQMLGGFVMHSLPSIVLTIVLVLAWRREWIGALVFAAAALFFLRFLIPNPLEQFGIILLFSAPLAVIALLFWMNWKWRAELHPLAPQA